MLADEPVGMAFEEEDEAAVAEAPPFTGAMTVSGWLEAELVAMEMLCPCWAADMACRTGKGSSPLEEMVTFGAAEMELMEVADVERIREDEVVLWGGWGVLGEAPWDWLKFGDGG